MNDGDCTAGMGMMPVDVSKAKIGDLVNIHTNEGKSWLVEVVNIYTDIVVLKNEYIYLEIDLTSKVMEIIYKEDDYEAHVETLPPQLINRDMVEFIVHSEDEQTRYILQLISLHLLHMNEDQKDKLIEALWEIQRPGSPRLKDGLSKPKYKCVFTER
jgi:hypothetical protein